MSRIIHSSAVTLLILNLISCGGGGGSNSSPTITPTVSPTPVPEAPIGEQIKQDLSGKSEQELKEMFSEYALFLYEGEKGLAKPDLKNVQAVMKSTFGENLLSSPALGHYLHLNIETLLSASTGSIDSSLNCENGGSLSLSGSVGGNETGVVEAQFDACQPSAMPGEFDGRVLVYVEPDVQVPTIFYDNTKFSTEKLSGTVSGYLESIDNQETQGFNSTVLYTLDENSEPYLHSLEYRNAKAAAEGATESLDGQVYLGSQGRINIATSERFDSRTLPTIGELAFSGLDKFFSVVRFESPEYTKFVTDTSGNGELDSGAYFTRGVNAFLTTPYNQVNLVALDELILPPVVAQPAIKGSSESPNHYDEIKVESTLSHPSIDVGTFDVRYRWSINGELQQNITGNTFPSGQVVKDDLVEVYAEVFDGVTTVRSDVLAITIQDAPVVLQIGEIPDSITYGETLTFTANAFDADLPSVKAPAHLYFGPAGMSIDAEGTVTWTPQATMFNSSQVNFAIVLNDGDEAYAQHHYSVSVVNPNQELPVVLANFPLRVEPKTFVAANFHGRNRAEVLSINHANQLSMLTFQDESYRESWTYPYSLEFGGDLVQVHAVEMDDDIQLEILAITDSAAHVLYDMNSMAKTLVEFDGSDVVSSAVADVDGNGIPEIAVILNRPSSPEERWLEVYELSNPVVRKTEKALLDLASDLLFSNVDGDDALELITSDGKVFDTQTWETKWVHALHFGMEQILAWDYDNDGVSHIVAYGPSEDAEFKIYSAMERKIIRLFENMPVCATQKRKSKTGQENIIIGACNAAVREYSFSGDALVLEHIISDDFATTAIAAGVYADEIEQSQILWKVKGEDALQLSTFNIKENGYNSKKMPLNVTEGVRYPLGWNELDEALFMQAGTKADLGRSLLYFSDLGGIRTSDKIPNSNISVSGGLVVDYDKDDSAEVFLNISGQDSNGFQVIDSRSLESIWSSESSVDSEVAKIDAADVNSDGFIDAIFMSYDTIEIIDVENGLPLTSFNAGSEISDFAIVPADSPSERPMIITASSTSLDLWEMQAGDYTKTSSTDVLCNRISLGNVDSDAALELVCASNNYADGWGLITLELNAKTLSLASEVKLSSDIEVYDFVFDTSEASNQDILVGLNMDAAFPLLSAHHVCKVSPTTGGIIWASSPLLGSVEKFSMRSRKVKSSSQSRLMFSTGNAAYLVK